MTTTFHAQAVAIAGSGLPEPQKAIRTDAANSVQRTSRRSVMFEVVKWAMGLALIVGVLADTWAQL